MCGFACALCVWQESQDRAVFGADTPRTIMCKYRSARVGVSTVRAHARAWTTGGPEWNGDILALQRDSFALVREAEALLSQTLAAGRPQEEAAAS